MSLKWETTITRRKALLAAGAWGAATFAQSQPAPAFTLPRLPYAVDALEPHIDARTMEIHHGKHHQAYVDNLNQAVAREAALQGKTLEQLLRQLDRWPESVRTVVRNHGGGHANHTLFWQCLSGKPRPLASSSRLAQAVEKQFGGVDGLKQQMTAAAMRVFGSGWAWLVRQPNGELAIETSPNQDSPLMTEGKRPLLGIDVWEHAYYLKYQNRRADYLAAIWNVIDWDGVRARFEEKG